MAKTGGTKAASEIPREGPRLENIPRLIILQYYSTTWSRMKQGP